jgi:hypothetical protein
MVDCICSCAGKYDISLFINVLLTQAPQLRFALFSTGSWHVIDNEVNHQEFSDNIVNFFELAVT